MKALILAGSLSLFSLPVWANFDFFSAKAPNFEVPEIGKGVGLLDQQNEKKIGEKVYREIHQQLPVLKNPWLEDQLATIFTQILSQANLGQPVGLLLINDPQINAFAVPGGLFALNTGLITNASNLDEVVGVMAHEVAHVSQRHYTRSQEAFKGQGLLALAGIVAGALLATQTDGNAGAAVMMGSQAALMGQQLTYSRNQEREADRIGMQYMYTAGYNPQSMADFFEVMHRKTSSVSWLPDFWLTHPLTAERMSEARLRANQFAVKKQLTPQQEFEILKWYSAVLSNDISEQQLSVFANRQNLAGQIALAAFYNKQGDYSKAQTILDQIQKQADSHTLITLIQTDVDLNQNHLDQALAHILPAARIMPENRALNYKLAEVYIRQKQPQKAQQIVQHFTKKNPTDISGWSLLQQAANVDVNNPMRAANVLRYRAEAQFWAGQEQEGIKSLLQAKRESQNDQVLTASIKKRLDQMQADYKLKL